MRFNETLFLCTSVFAFGGSGTAGAQPDPGLLRVDRERQAVEATLDGWIQAYQRGDPEALASFFTVDAVYAANTGELLTGRDGIRSGVAAWMKGFSRVGQKRRGATLDLQRRQLRFNRQGSVAYDLARFTIAMNPPGCIVDSGHALSVLEEQPDGRWLIAALTVNQDKSSPKNACPH